MRIPDERSLAKHYDVSRSSMKRALELLAQQEDDHKAELRIIWVEAHELTMIFNKSCQTLKN